MSLTEFYNDFHLGEIKPSTLRLAEALALAAPNSAVTHRPGSDQRDVNITGRYTSLTVTEDIQLFNCDMTFDNLFETRGYMPSGMWVGALFSGNWHTQIQGEEFSFPADGTPRLVAVGERSQYFDRPEAKRRMRMSSFLLTKSFFDRVAQDDPQNQFHGLRALLGPEVCVRTVPQANVVSGNLQRLLDNPYRGEMSVIYVESLIMASVFDLAAQFTVSDAPREPGLEKSLLAYEARTLINDAPEKFTSIVDLAKDLGTNETSLQRQFRKTFDVTIFEYVSTLRMQSARILVRDAVLPISEIGYRVGYRSPANFSTAYKRFFGCSPADDRRLN